MQKLREKLKNKKGFTLVEMIVVLAIIGILIALIAPNMARIIKDGQETSDAAKAKTALTAAQAFGTRQVSTGHSVAIPTGGAHHAVGATGAFVTELTNDNMKAIYTLTSGGTTTPTLDDFMSNTGNAYLNTGVVSGDDKLFVYVSKEGAAMGIVYATNGKIKAVAGFAPAGAVSAPAGGGTAPEFTTAALKDKVFDPTTGLIAG